MSINNLQRYERELLLIFEEQLISFELFRLDNLVANFINFTFMKTYIIIEY